jgi:GAF domain-containing protein
VVPVDPGALQRSVQQLLTSVDAIAYGGVRPVSDGLKTLIAVAEHVLGVDCVGVLLVDEHERLRAVASSGPVAAALEQAQEHLKVGPGVDTVRSSETVVVNDLAAAEEYHALAQEVGDLGVRAVVSAPIWVNGAVAGNLNAMRFEAHTWTDADVAAAETYAQVVATLLQLDAVSRPPFRSPGTVHG